ncbi:MAG: histone H1 [Candidatus Kapaibacterium sp.]|nr:MAG: histone H1 [Candidatus Kapabacteria bacterium]
MNRYEELQDLIKTFEVDFVKFYDKGNKEAGIRLRKHMQSLRSFGKEVRKDVQDQKDTIKQTLESRRIPK